MPNYRRDYTGLCWFFTVVTLNRCPLLTIPFVRSALRSSIQECKVRYPFEIDALVLLPDHLHCIWRLPETDRNYSRRWGLIKKSTSQRLTGTDIGFAWQKRFWAHRIDTEQDYRNHFDYIHFNPVKHGHVNDVIEWPWSTFHRCVRSGIYPEHWGGGLKVPSSVGRE